jgi:hypothetical protein
MNPLRASANRLSARGRALRPWLGRTLLPAAVLDPSVHGGKSTGPRTPEGLERSRRANWKHGHYSREAKAERSRVRAAILALRYLRMLGH